MRAFVFAGAMALAGAAQAADGTRQVQIDSSMFGQPIEDARVLDLRTGVERTVAEGDEFGAALIFFLEQGGFEFVDDTPDAFLFNESGQFAGSNLFNHAEVEINTASGDTRDPGGKFLEVVVASADGGDLFPAFFSAGDRSFGEPNGSVQFDIGQESALMRSGLAEDEAGINFNDPEIQRRLDEVLVTVFRDGIPFVEANTTVDELVGPNGLRWSVLLGDGDSGPRGKGGQGFFGLGIDEISVVFIVSIDEDTPDAKVPVFSTPAGAALASLLGLAGAFVVARRLRS